MLPHGGCRYRVEYRQPVGRTAPAALERCVRWLASFSSMANASLMRYRQRSRRGAGHGKRINWPAAMRSVALRALIEFAGEGWHVKRTRVGT